MANAYADGAKVPHVDRENSTNVQTLGNRRNQPVHQPDLKRAELGVKRHRTPQVFGVRRLEAIGRDRIEDVVDKPAHRGAILAKEVVDLGQYEGGHHNQASALKRSLKRRPCGSTAWPTSQRPQEATRVG